MLKKKNPARSSDKRNNISKTTQPSQVKLSLPEVALDTPRV
jgi:hypothetical protein